MNGHDHNLSHKLYDRKSQHHKLGSIVISVLMAVTIENTISSLIEVLGRILTPQSESFYGELALFILLINCVILSIDFLLYEVSFHRLCTVRDVQLNFLSAIQRLIFVSVLGTPISISYIVNISAVGFLFIALTHWVRAMEWLPNSLRRLKKRTCSFVMALGTVLLVGWHLTNSELFFLLIAILFSVVATSYIYGGWKELLWCNWNQRSKLVNYQIKLSDQKIAPQSNLTESLFPK